MTVYSCSSDNNNNNPVTTSVLSLTFQAQIKKLVLDGSDEIAMDGSSSAREPHQVSRITCGFADPTSEPVARSYSSLD